MTLGIDILQEVLRELREEKETSMTEKDQKDTKPPIFKEGENGLVKRCSKCEEYYPADHEYFYNDGRAKLNLSSQCQACASGKSWEDMLAARGNEGQSDPADKDAGNEFVLALNFSGDQDLLGMVLVAAQNDRRTPDQQVMWWLEKQLIEAEI